MNNKILLIPVSFLVFASCLNQSKKEAESQKPLNILLITADDLGKQISCYGDDIIETINIDKLARSGMIFHNAYVTQASCSPSRSSILTGIYPHTNGQMGLASGFKLNQKYQNLATTLKAEGYTTGIIGKLHVKPADQFPFDYEKKDFNETRDVELVVRRAEDFIRSSGQSPFFLYLNYTDPHVPFFREVKGRPVNPVNPSDVSEFNFQGVDDPEQLQRIADYYCCVRRLDEGIGLLMSKLDELGVLDNTMIIFIGDHGAPFSRGKTACYESSVNIPFLVSCPKLIKSNQESNALVSTVDIFPTIMDALGYSFSEDVQGKSLMPVFSEEKKSVRQYLFTEFNYHGNSLNHFYPRRTIRDDRYKLILNLAYNQITNGILGVDGDKAYTFSQKPKYDNTWVREAFNRLKMPPEIEFFDLQNDPFEIKNLAGDTEYAGKIEELSNELYQWMASTNDPFFSIENVYEEIEILKNGKNNE